MNHVSYYKSIINKANKIFYKALSNFSTPGKEKTYGMDYDGTVFTKTFASLLKNNVFITESIDILSKITNNEIYKEIMATTIDNIARGDKISTAFKDHWAVPSVAYYMIVTGESTGELAQMLDKVSQYYQEQHRAIVSNLKALIEPILIAGLAIVVGGIILAVIVPMFDMYGELAG